MPARENKFKTNSVNYLDRDFSSLKKSLMQYATAYFPNTYRDFNETSPGMMLMEMSAYVGDVLNFYIDQQYREQLLTLAEERKNLIHLSRAFGYKVKTSIPAYVDITVEQKVSANTTNPAKVVPEFSEAVVLDSSMQCISTVDSNIVFETLDVVDFTVSSSADKEPVQSAIDEATGLASEYTLQRKVKAVSGETKTTTFTVGAPQKFVELTLPEKNVIEVLKCTDTNGNRWYEVDYLAQDKVPIEEHYTSDVDRSTAYSDRGDNTSFDIPVPYSLEYLQTTKRFVTQVNEDNTTSLVFGNGILRNGQTVNTMWKQIEQIGVNIPGQVKSLDDSVNPLLGDHYSTLGESPTQTTLTVQYRVGGGISSNVIAGDLETMSANVLNGASVSNVTIINEKAAGGGADGETNEEIRQRAIAHFSTQERAVTRRDYESRILNMPSRYGNIAKVYVTRGGLIDDNKTFTTVKQNSAELIRQVIQAYNTSIGQGGDGTGVDLSGVEFDLNDDGSVNTKDIDNALNLIDLAGKNVTQADQVSTIDVYVLSYDNNKNLVETPPLIFQNLKTYLSNFRLITDQVNLLQGYVINFGIVFDVVANRDANKSEVKAKCMRKLMDYFHIDKQQFKDIIYRADLEYELMGVDGVRAVNHVTMTQDTDWIADPTGTKPKQFKPALFDKYIGSDNKVVTGNNPGFGYYYDFSRFYEPNSVAGNGVILPGYEPTIFELKNPNQNIKGVVR